MDFTFKHQESGEIKTVTLSPKEIQRRLMDDLYNDCLSCDCEPIGETNVVECNCEEYLCGFELQDRSEV